MAKNLMAKPRLNSQRRLVASTALSAFHGVRVNPLVAEDQIRDDKVVGGLPCLKAITFFAIDI